MTIERLSFPGGIVLNRQIDVRQLAIDNLSRVKKMPVGVHDVTPPHMAQLKYGLELEVFRDGTGVVRHPDRNPRIRGDDNIPHPLRREGDMFILTRREQSSKELRLYETILYVKGKSPKR